MSFPITYLCLIQINDKILSIGDAALNKNQWMPFWSLYSVVNYADKTKIDSITYSILDYNKSYKK